MLIPVFCKPVLVVENRFKTVSQFYWPSLKFKFQTQFNLLMYGFFGGHIWSFN